MPGENCVNRPPEIADSFAVDDSDLADSLLMTSREIVRDQVFDFARIKGVQIEHTIDR